MFLRFFSPSTFAAALLCSGYLGTGCAPAENDHAPGLNVSFDGGPGIVPMGGRGGYPDGPYGVNNPEVGEVIEDLQLEGYFSKPGQVTSTERELVKASLGEIREQGASYLLVHTSSFWCNSCRVEAFFMSDKVAEIQAAGGDVLELIIDGSVSGIDPQKSEIDIWVETSDLRMTTMGAAEDRVRKVFPDRDYVYVIDLDTMKVVWRKIGPAVDPTTSEIGAEEMLDNWLLNEEP